MGKNLKHYGRYRYPLPIEPLRSPAFSGHPAQLLSWVAFCLFGRNRTKFIDIEINELDQIIVSDPAQMKFLWEHGFFGTGQLSRSEPSWKERTLSRLQLGGDEMVNLEYITDVRRRQRIEFKKHRAYVEQKKLEMRKSGVVDEKLLEEERLLLKQLRDKELEFEQRAFGVRTEDRALIENGSVINLESLQLMPVEALFLTFALPVLTISPGNLMDNLIPDASEYTCIKSFLLSYVSYHHYRSKGWCVRSGIKFGCDYLLYKRGPPFHHAEYGIMVLDSGASNDYTWYSSIARVVGGARKNLVFCYVQLDTTEDNVLHLWKQHDYQKLFSSFTVHEILYKRWIPGKNRD